MKNPLETMQETCQCGDRPLEECPGEWEPGCDLGNNETFAKISDPRNVRAFSAESAKKAFADVEIDSKMNTYQDFENQTIVQKLRIRAQIRRNATSRKSVQENQPDRLTDPLEEAADVIVALQNRLTQNEHLSDF